MIGLNTNHLHAQISLMVDEGKPNVRLLTTGTETVSVTIKAPSVGMDSYRGDTLILRATANENAHGQLYLSPEYARHLAMSILAVLDPPAVDVKRSAA